MSMNLKCLLLLTKKEELYTLLSLVLLGTTGFFPVLAPDSQKAEADFEMVLDQNQVLADTSTELSINPEPVEWTDFSTIQSNSLIPLLNSSEPNIKVVRRISVIVTGYSSSPWETDEDPFTTAAGTWVREGIIANNLLPFGTKVMLPDIYGSQIFVVEDRMNSRKGIYQIDIWFPSRESALEFGAKLTRMEIIEEI